MSKVIKGGTVCTADRAWKADVLIEGETIKQIGEDLAGDEYLAPRPPKGNVIRGRNGSVREGNSQFLKAMVDT